MNQSSLKSRYSFSRRFSARDLVVIGVFAACAKLSTLLIAMVGGGMNPVSLLVKNMVFTTLLVIMLFKVNKIGTLFLFTVVSCLINLMFLGGNVTLIPPMLLAAGLSELLIYGSKNAYPKASFFFGAAAFDFFTKFFSLGISYLMMRESPALMMVVIPFVVIGYVGSLMGLYSGWRTIKELRHAGIIAH